MNSQSVPPESLRSIAARLDEVSASLSAVTSEVRALSAVSAAGTTTASQPAPAAPQPWSPHVVPPRQPWPQHAPQQPPWPSMPSMPQVAAPTKPSLTERLGQEGMSSRVLVWIGGAITLIGVVLMLVLAIQQGWIGPVARVVLGAALGGALIGAAFWARRSPAGKTGAFALAGTGLATLYLDVVAATTLLELAPPWAGLAVGLVIAAGGLTLAGRWNAEPLAMFVLLGSALCAPMITVGFDALLLGFLLALLVGSTPLQLMRRWTWVPLAAGVPAALVALVAPAISIQNEWPAAGAALLASALIATSALLTAAQTRDDRSPMALLLLAPVPVLVLGLHLPELVAALAAMLLAVPLGVVWAVTHMRHDVVPRLTGTAAGGVSAVCAMFATALLLPGDAEAIGLLGEAGLVALLAVAMRSRGVLISASVFASVGLVFALATTASPTRVLLPPALPPASLDLVIGVLTFTMIAVAALAVLSARAWLDRRVPTEGAEPVVRLSQIASGVVTLYGATGVILSAALLVLPDRSGFLFGHTVVTIGWMVAALLLLHRGITRRGSRVAGLVLVGAALVKLVLFDLAALDGIARVAAFLGAGLVLLGAGVRYARLVEQAKVTDHTTDPGMDLPPRSDVRGVPPQPLV